MAVDGKIVMKTEIVNTEFLKLDTIVAKAYVVSGLPHILLAHDKSPAWQSLYDSYAKVREDIEKTSADLILYFSTQWLSVIGYLFQADPNPEWLHVDPNWYDFGSIPYKFKVDTDFAQAYASEVKKLGHNVKCINYKGFPIDTGTIVAQKLLNPNNRLPAGMVSCNMYSEKDDSLEIGEAGARALAKQGKKAIVVLVSNLSNRYEIKEIDPQHDKISSAKDNEWNLKILELLGEGRLEDVSQCTREFSKQANADMNGKGIWWLNGLCGKSNNFTGKVYDYQPVWGTGAALASLTPLETAEIELREDFGKSETNKNEATTSFFDTTFKPLKENKPIEEKKVATKVEPEKIFSSRAPEPVGAYPHARKFGNLLFLSGIGPRNKGTKIIPGVTLDDNGKIESYDIEIQTRSVIENVKTILEDSGSSFEKIIDVQVFLTNMEKDFKKFNEVYKEYFSEVAPTRTTVCVTALPTPIAVEFKVIANI